MARYKERKLFDMEIDHDRFENLSSQVQVHDAISAIQRLRDDGRILLKENTKIKTKWEEYCNDILEFINSLGRRRHHDPDLAETLRAFIPLFEHSTIRMYQMMHSSCTESDFKCVLKWFSFTYKLCTCAIVSFWCEDKQDVNRCYITMEIKIKDDEDGDGRQGTCRTWEDWYRKEAELLKKYEFATKKL